MPDNHLYYNGADGGATLVSSAALSVTGAIDLRAKMSFDVIAGGEAELVNKYVTSGNLRSYRLIKVNGGSSVALGLSANGTAFTNHTSTATLAGAGLSDFQVFWLRATFAPSDEVIFYTSVDDQVSWQQLGDAVSTSIASIDANAAAVNIGDRGGSVEEHKGEFHRVQILNGISGTLVLDADFTQLTAADLEAGTFTESSSQAATVTLNGAEWAYVRPYGPGILGSAELLLMADDGNKGFSPKWADRSGNDHHAQLGSAAGTDTNDPTFTAYDRTQYVRLPGLASNSVSTPSVNLLNSDTANSYQSIGNWIHNTGSAPTLVADSDDEAFGGKAIEQTPTSAQTFLKTAASAAVNATLVAAQEYTFAVWVKADSISPTTALVLQLDWRDSGDSSLGINGGSAVNLIAGEYVKLFVTATSPSNTTYARTYIAYSSGSDFDGSQNFHLGRATVHAGAATTFIPSVRIVGDLDVRAKLKMPDWTPAAAPRVINNEVSLTGYSFSVAASGSIVCHHLDGTANPLYAKVHGLSDGDTAEIRATVDISTGIAEFFVDGVSVGTDTKTQATPTPSSAAVFLGTKSGSDNLLDGDLFWAEIRDGIGGPVVARFDATELSEPHASYTDSGRNNVWTVNRASSGLLATVVDRDMFLLSTDNYLEVADHADLDFAASVGFTLMALVRTNTIAAGSDIIVAKKDDLTTSAGYYLLRSTAAVEVRIADGTLDDVDSAAAAFAIHTLNAVGMQRDVAGDDTIEAIDDGALSGGPTADSTTVTLANALPLRIGATSGTAANFWEGSVMAVVLWRSVLSPAEIAAAKAMLAVDVYPSGLMLSSVGL